MKIEILNWEKHNPKRDQKTYTWFRLQNGIASDKDFYGLTAEQKWVWIVILCEASKKNCGVLEFDIEWLVDIARVKKAVIESLFRLLEEKRIISSVSCSLQRATPNCRDHDKLLPLRTNVRTYETNERTNEEGVNSQTPVIPFSTGQLASLGPDRNPVALWVKAYKEKYGVRYALQKKDFGILKNFGSQYGPDRSEVLFACYLAIEEPFYSNAKHPLSLFFRDLQKISVAAQTGIDPSQPARFDVSKLKD